MAEFYGKEVLELIPQRPPIVMIDTFCGETDTEALAKLTVLADNMFCGGGRLAESGIIEHIAQSASALAGYNAKKKGKSVPLGYIGEVKTMQIHFLPLVGDELQTKIRIVSEIYGVSLLAAVTNVGGREAAQCRMKIFIQES